MRFEAQKALIAYSGALTAAVIGLLITGTMKAPDKTVFGEIDVHRINIREPDGTLRMTISNQAAFPEAIVKGQEYPHPNRDTAGMLFFNEEGTETGGLVWSGRMIDGKRTSSGSLTFDRYEQDQTVQMVETEDGDRRMSGFRVNDQPEGSMEFSAFERIQALPADEQGAAYAAANVGGTQRAFLGRQISGASELVLRDAEGNRRLVLSVAPDGTASIDFLDAMGQTIRTVTPEG